LNADRAVALPCAGVARRGLRIVHLGIAFVVAAVLGLTWLSTAPTASAAQPTCAQEARRSADGRTVIGSPCADRIIVTSPQVKVIFGGGGNDVIYANAYVEEVLGEDGDDVIYGEPAEVATGEPPASVGPPSGIPYEPAEPRQETRIQTFRFGSKRQLNRLGASASNTVNCTSNPCRGGLGSQQLLGGNGNDVIFGERGNDTLYGNEGHDALYGGVGDEVLISGGVGEDLLAGGPGADQLNGNQENDLLRGDTTIDTLEDTGGTAGDTISFATGVAPGFEGTYAFTGFPLSGNAEERGVRVRLDGGEACAGGFEACDGDARYGGGTDEIAATGIENVIGTPFADVIIGSSVANRLEGGGGADVIEGGGDNDVLVGGAEGDYIAGGGGTDTAAGEAGVNKCAVDVENPAGCSGSEASVVQRDRSKISAGLMTSGFAATVHWTQLYLVGSNTARDNVSASFYIDGGGTGHVVFTAEADSATFNLSGEASTPNCTYAERKVDCTLATPPDAIVMAGMAGNDHLSVAGGSFWETASVMLVGGEGEDWLQGSGSTEDVLVDGTGAWNDATSGYGYDDFLTNNEGADALEGGAGNDLLLSAAICSGDTLQGAEGGSGDGAAQNSASWAKMPAPNGVVADLQTQTAGNYYNSGPACSAGAIDTLKNLDDLEGSSQSDALFGDGNANNILGRLGDDGLYGRAASDRIEAVDGGHDTVGGGGGTDDCLWDNGIDTVSECDVTTTTFSTVVRSIAGQPGYVTVDGHVYGKAPDGSNIPMNGVKVNVRFYKKESGTYVYKNTAQVPITNSYYRVENWSVGLGEWQVKAEFSTQGTYDQSESGLHPFTIVANGWHSNESLGGTFTADPDIASQASGRLDVFGRGAENSLWVKSLSGGTWGAWGYMGGALTSGPGAVSWATNRIDVVAADGANSVAHWYWNGASWAADNLGGFTNADPDISSWEPNRLDVFVRGSGNNLHHKWWAGGWSGWENMGGNLAGGPGAVSWGPNRIDVVARMTDNTIGHWYWGGAGWAFDSLGGTLTSDADIASWGSGRLDVFARGTDNGLWHKYYPAPGGWSAWQPLGGYITSGPAAVSWGSGRIDVVARGADNSLLHWWFQ
jgi:Ca2+-binding RTX toxin-like protein